MGEKEIAKDIENTKIGLKRLSSNAHVYELEMALNAVSPMISDGEALSSFNKALRPAIGKLRSEHKADAAAMEVDVPSEITEHAKRLMADWKLKGARAFFYFESYGFPLEMTMEIMAEHGIDVEAGGFEKAFEAHQEKSRAGAEQKFAGGLADHSDETKKLHTATHLMLEALRRVLGDHVEQKGSNITAERLRFDFNHSEKVTKEQLAEVEQIVNDAIQADHKVSVEELTVEEARAANATGVFVDKYEGELSGKVKVYTMGDFSKEICGGPHVEHTGELGTKFKIVKEQSSSAGIRRIKAVLE
ncbi:hypothetical protein HOD30_03965 [Candidatus Peregrinibacteria bacterium]|nr:hypothetical protein [Candidatus Peregrinibacteria bacterium]MBT4632100.1 hypothetical protein [Candidatus Peregrinibacteria bacterium]MBT5516528.1 hypothetical protein [Candidatus Peregrinibacteria bacterium]MBT5823566.1 hypothetical protein [Candidatus Peregrinibacteria bacterium]